MSVAELCNQYLCEAGLFLDTAHTLMNITRETYFGSNIESIENKMITQPDFVVRYEEITSILFAISEFLFNAKNLVNQAIEADHKKIQSDLPLLKYN